MSNYSLDEVVIMLHHLARAVEKEYGYHSPLSRDIRKCADRVNETISVKIDDENDRVIIDRVMTNTQENILKVLKA